MNHSLTKHKFKAQNIGGTHLTGSEKTETADLVRPPLAALQGQL
jgi:hypothetical protein